METENKELFNYTLETISVEDFREYYEKCNTFNSFSEKKFLGAVGIPGNYYMEQPEDTKTTLLENKEGIIPEKLSGKHVVILKKDNQVLNCARIDLVEHNDIYERVKLKSEKGFTPIRDFIKEGYTNLFKSINTPVVGQYNKGIFIDVPLMCNKPVIISKGFHYVPENDAQFVRNIYTTSKVMDINEYQHLDLFIEDEINSIYELDNIIENMKTTNFLREMEEFLYFLVEQKIFSRGYVKRILKYVDKNSIPTNTIFSVLDLILSYDLSIKGYKKVSTFRNMVNHINNYLTGV